MIRFECVRRLLSSKVTKVIEIAAAREVRVGPYSFWHVGCRIVLPDTSVAGYGVASSVSDAKLKAIMEAIERAAIQDYEVQGGAAHFSRGIARKSALLEMIERHTWLHFLAGGFPPLSDEQLSDIRIIELPTFYSKVHIYAAIKFSNECVSYGLGTAFNVGEAKFKAMAELGLSLVRHEARFCIDDHSLYGRLHRRSNSVAFLKRMREPPQLFSFLDKGSLESLAVTYQTWKGPHLWPISVVSVSSESLLKWDLAWLENPGMDHPNTRLLSALGLHPSLSSFATG